jgi:hypothetical protein
MDERSSGRASTNGAAQSEACAVGGMWGDKAWARVAAQRSSGLFFGYFLWASKESNT